MWIRTSDKKLLNTDYMQAIIMREINDDLGEVVVFYGNIEVIVTNPDTYKKGNEYIDDIQRLLMNKDFYLSKDAVFDLRIQEEHEKNNPA